MERTQATRHGRVIFTRPFSLTLGGLMVACLGGACSADNTKPTAVDVDRAANARITDILDEIVILFAGRYEGEPVSPDSASRSVVVLVEHPYASGDLDGDGIDELAVVVVASFGGSGSFRHLVVLDMQSEPPRSLATRLLGDRVEIAEIKIRDGIVHLDTVEHAPGDPMCCPTEERYRRWSYQDGKLTSLDEPAVFVRGHVTVGHEVRAFVECGNSREGWLIDRTDGELIDVVSRLSPAPYQPVFVEILAQWGNAPTTGFGADYEASLTVTELIRAENEGHGCALDTSSFDFDLRGNEPSWRLTVDDIAMRFSSMNGTSFDANVDTVVQSLSEVRVAGKDGDTDIDVVIDQERCVDSMSGAHYSLSATVRAGSQTWTGCAVAGRQWRSKLTPSSKPTDGS